MEDLTPKQIADLAYNDRQVKNYKWNIKKKIEEEEKIKEQIQAYKDRMASYKPEHKMYPHDYYISEKYKT
jgi:phage protein D